MPANLLRLHAREEELRRDAIVIVSADPDLALHLRCVEGVMDFVDVLRQFPTEDDDLKLIQVLGIRVFNALGCAVKLVFSGYAQKSCMILRDVLETSFLIEFFTSNSEKIVLWRVADARERTKRYAPIQIRMALDKRDGFKGREREKAYKLLCDLASHPSMLGIKMLRPEGSDVQIGPFLDEKMFKAVIAEMGKLSVEAGTYIKPFFPVDWHFGNLAKVAFHETCSPWLKQFMGISV